MDNLARPKMNVPKALARRRRLLQRYVTEALGLHAMGHYSCYSDLIDEWRAEIKWLRYMEREVTGRGRVR